MTHFYGLFESMYENNDIQTWPIDMNYNDEQNRFCQVARQWNMVKPRGEKLNALLEEFLELDYFLNPTMAIYSAGRDVMRARNADWHERYTLPTLMDYFQPSRENHGAYWFYWTTHDEVAWKKFYQVWMRFLNDYKNMGGKVTVGNVANPLFATPDEETGNSIITGSGSIERYHAVNINENKYALLDSTEGFIDSVEWTGTDSTELLASQTNATNNITKIKYDKVRLHLRSGFSFAARGYEGFLLEVKTNRTTGVQNFLTQTVYLNTSSFEIKNPRPFILSETLYSNFIEIKLPTLKDQFVDFDNLFYDNGSGSSDLDPTSIYEVSLKLIDVLEDTAGTDYIYT